MSQRKAPLTPQRAIDLRPHLPFHRELRIVFDGALIPQDAPTFFRSQGMEMHGLSLVDCFTSVDIMTDTNPGGAIALFGVLRQSFGASGADSQIQGIAQGIPGFGKAYVGTGGYALPVIRGGNVQERSTSSLAVAFELRGVGAPAGRELTVAVDGIIVAGGIF